MYFNATPTLPHGATGRTTPPVVPLAQVLTVYVPQQAPLPTSLHGFEGYTFTGVSLDGEPRFNCTYEVTTLPSQWTAPQVRPLPGFPLSGSSTTPVGGGAGLPDSSPELQAPQASDDEAQEESANSANNSCSTGRQDSSSSAKHKASPEEAGTESIPNEEGSADQDFPELEELVASSHPSASEAEDHSRHYDAASSDPEYDDELLRQALSRGSKSSGGPDGATGVRSSSYDEHELEQALGLLQQLRIGWDKFDLKLKDKRLQTPYEIDTCLAWAIAFPGKVEYDWGRSYECSS